MSTVIAIPGERLSLSQVRTFIECGAKWAFRYLEGLEEPLTGSLVLGKAIHAALEFNFRQKIQSHQDLPTEEVVEVYRVKFQALSKEAEFRDDEDPAAMLESGARMLALYHEDFCPAIQPALVEHRLESEIGGVSTIGFVDVVDVGGLIIDFKTAAKKPSEVSPDHAFQLASYTALGGRTTARCRIDTLVKTKTVQVVQLRHDVTDEDVRYVSRVYPLAQQSIQDGVFIPNRNSMLCSRRNCGYWRDCQKDFGGRVRE